jgi:hypothetical protein
MTALVEAELDRSFRELNRRLDAAGISADFDDDAPPPEVKKIMDEVFAALSPAAREACVMTGLTSMINGYGVREIAAGRMIDHGDESFTQVLFAAPDGVRDAVMRTLTAFLYPTFTPDALEFVIAKQADVTDTVLSTAGPRIRAEGYEAALQKAIELGSLDAVRDLLAALRRSAEEYPWV